MKKGVILILLIVVSLYHSHKSEAQIKYKQKNSQMKKSELTNQQKEEIRSALESLLQKEGLDAFVIIDETNSGKFVQFAVNENQLLFDLPTGQLNDNQLDKAKSILAEFEIFHQVQRNEFGVFTKEIGGDVDLAIEIVERLIKEVFNIEGNIKLLIEEN